MNRVETSPTTLIPVNVQPPPRWANIMAVGLLAVQALLIADSLRWNWPTVDERSHLPVGLYYWDTGLFGPYHHNPPLTRLLYSLPLLVQDVPRTERGLLPEELIEGDYGQIREDFYKLNRANYPQTFNRARLVGILFALIGGYTVYLWARNLFGWRGGFVSLALWSFSPFILGHAGLVTPDVPAAAMMIAASYAFWRYLRSPSMEHAFMSGILLGLAEATKFTAVVLPPIWVVVAAVRFTRRHSLGDPPPSRLLAHASLLTAISLAVLNAAYGWEGTGRALGDFEFRSPSLTRAGELQDGTEGPPRINRFRGSVLAEIPVPFPKHYLLGFDHQLEHLESGNFPKYLRGDLRRGDEEGWWYYYLYGMVVKLPLGTLALFAVAGVLFMRRRFRTDAVAELALLLPVCAVLFTLSTKTALNVHVRYVIPMLPYLFVFVGRLGLWFHGIWNWKAVLVGLALMANVISVGRCHPFYIPYFNEAAGGPMNGYRHLADSNIDWGQGLPALRDWIEKNAPNETVYVACFALIDAEELGPNCDLLDPADPKPGLHAISATLLAGVPSFGKNRRGELISWPQDCFANYRHLKPVAAPGLSVYVYRVADSAKQRSER